MPAPCTLGVLVQANFGGVLRVVGVPVDAREALASETDSDPADVERGNSCMIVVATDAPLDSSPENAGFQAGANPRKAETGFPSGFAKTRA